ncbi:histone demethylase UTY [Galendromus occidentalis]|uniref:Histone demethylase UTY n=1 Tax=Galendromus occidentalis TaxID=34638 RepID=A0AAJ7WIF1_9ACAR|nr:histone demethylase UTY [Galendromus occidentalis]
MSSPDYENAQQVPQDDASYKLMPSRSVRGGPFRMPPDVMSKGLGKIDMKPPLDSFCPPPMAPPMMTYSLEKSVCSKYNVRDEGDPIKRMIREGVDIKDERKHLKLLLRKRKSGNFESMSRDSLGSSGEESGDDDPSKEEVLYEDARFIHPAHHAVKVNLQEFNACFSKNMTAKELEKQCAVEDLGHIVPTMALLDDYTGPKFPARDGPRLPREKLLPKVKFVTVRTAEEALNARVKAFCTSHPITIVRNMCNVLKVDLSLFSTKALSQSNPEHTIEVRTQFQQSSDENWDADKVRQIWRCESHRGHTTVSRYAQYQSETYVESLKNKLKQKGGDLELPELKEIEFSDSESDSNLQSAGTLKPKRQRRSSSFKTIKFGTNLDLSDHKKWGAQLNELQKLPPFARVVDESNMLSHVGHTILGMNTVQLYMKVPGSRTPGHQENNNFCSVNINIGPGDCEWFGVDDAYWGDIHALCERNGTSYLFGSWWPLQEDLLAANIPVYRFTQKPGDTVFVNAGCVHWVQASGWCNNVAWNIGPFNLEQYRLGVERYEWNRMQGFKSIVPMLHLTWNLARNLTFVDVKGVTKKIAPKLTAKNESLMEKVLWLQKLGNAASEEDRNSRIRNIQPVEEELFRHIQSCLMTSLRCVERQRKFVRRLGKNIIFHGRNDDEETYYCNSCDVEVFNILFVKEIDKKHMVHCIECALKLSKTLKNIVVLEEYTKEELHRIYDNFVLKKIADIPASRHSSGSTSNS